MTGGRSGGRILSDGFLVEVGRTEALYWRAAHFQDERKVLRRSLSGAQPLGELAEIPDVRIHEVRHTFASLLVSGGASLEMIGLLLSHTQIGTTQGYAHLIDAPLRAGVNAVGEMLKPRLRVVGE